MTAGAASVPPQPVASPCNSVCRMDPANGLCLGCSRTLDEIAGWSRMADADKQRIIDQLPLRAPAPKEARP
jgi:hypothetical protein